MLTAIAEGKIVDKTLSFLRGEVLRALGKGKISSKESFELNALIRDHTTSALCWKFNNTAKIWTFEKFKFRWSRNFTEARAKKVLEQALTHHFRQKVFVPIEDLQKFKFCNRPLVPIGQTIFKVINLIPWAYPTPILEHGRQYVTVKTWTLFSHKIFSFFLSH